MPDAGLVHDGGQACRRVTGSRYLDRMLLPDECVIYAAGLHGVIYVNGFLMLAGGALLGGYGADLARFMPVDGSVAGYMEPAVTLAALMAVVIGGLMLVFSLIRQSTTDIVVTNMRVISKHGCLAITVCEAMIAKISNVGIEQTCMGRLLGYGDVTISGSGGDIPTVHTIASPFALYFHVMRTARQTAKAAGISLPTFHPPLPPSRLAG